MNWVLRQIPDGPVAPYLPHRPEVVAYLCGPGVRPAEGAGYYVLPNTEAAGRYRCRTPGEYVVVEIHTDGSWEMVGVWPTEEGAKAGCLEEQSDWEAAGIQKPD